MNYNFKYEKVSGFLNPNLLNYSMMRLLGVLFIALALWIQLLNDKSNSITTFIGNVVWILMGIYFVLPKQTGLFKQSEFIQIDKKKLRWNLGDIKNTKEIRLNTIKEVQNKFGTVLLVDTTNRTHTIPIHRIHDKDKLNLLYGHLKHKIKTIDS